MIDGCLHRPFSIPESSRQSYAQSNGWPGSSTILSQSSMRTAGPATRPPHPFLQVRTDPLDVLPPCLLFFNGDRPADPLVPGKRRDVFPCRSCLRVRGERFAEISRKIVHDASGKSNSCHWIILPRFRFRPIIHFSLPQWALCPTYRSFIAMSGPPRLTTFPSKRETAATLTKPGKWKNHHPRRWACRAGHSLERKERISSDPFETPGYGRSWQPGESPRRCRQAAARR